MRKILGAQTVRPSGSAPVKESIGIDPPTEIRIKWVLPSCWFVKPCLGLAPEVIKLSSPALCRFDARAALPADKRGYRTYLDELVPPVGVEPTLRPF